MTIKLHLGVIDVPYGHEPGPKRLPKAKAGKQRPRGKSAAAQAGAGQTTGQVAEILEGKYHVIETFYELHEEEIAQDFADAMAGALENLFSGAPAVARPYSAAEAEVTARFKRFLEQDEMAHTSTPGVPTRAARKGVNHRLKVKKGVPRPSFIDTGLYQSSFIAWTDDNA